MRINHRWWLALVFTGLFAGCPINCKSNGAWGSNSQVAAKGLNIHNCTQYQVGVFWAVGIAPDWNSAESQIIDVPSSDCRAGEFIDFEDGKTYSVRHLRNQGDCASKEGESYFEPGDCANHGATLLYIGDDNEPADVVEVKL